MRPLSVSAIVVCFLVFVLSCCLPLTASAEGEGKIPRRQPRPFEPTNLLTLDPWNVQQESWPEAWRQWLPLLPPLPAPIAVGDFDGDRHVDIVVAEMSLAGKIRLLHGKRAGEFWREEIIYEADSSEVSPITSLLPVDIDGDEALDLYVVRWGRNELLINDGSGHLYPWGMRTGRSLGLEDRGLGVAAAFFDAEGDGDLDLYVANVAERSAPLRGSPNRFYLDMGPVFSEHTEASGLDDTGHTIALSVRDLDFDGDPDIAVTNYLGPSNVYTNVGGGSFVLEEADSSALAHLGSDAADLDGDLRPDLLVTAVGHPGLYMESNRLRLSSGRGRDPGQAAGMNRFLMASWPHFCDFDNDGRVDIVFGRAIPRMSAPPERLYAVWVGAETDASGSPIPRFPLERSAAGRRAQPRTAWTLARNAGSAWMEEVNLGAIDLFREATRGVVWLDADEDGDADLLVAEEGGKLNLFMNRSGQARRALSATVRSLRANRMGLGAQVYVRTTEGMQVRTVESGTSDLRAPEGVVCFGLGDAEVRDLIVRWPRGRWQTVEAGTLRTIRIEEDYKAASEDPPSWLARVWEGDAPVSHEGELFEYEQRLLEDPTDFDLAWSYRQACRARDLIERPIAFFRGHEPADAPFAWSLQRLLAYVDGMRVERLDGEVLAQRAGLSVYELERLRILYPDTWLVEHLLGTNLLYWPPLFSQLDESIAAFKRSLQLQEGRREEHLVETFLGLGDAYALDGDETKAREVWGDGLQRFPGDEILRQRLSLASGTAEEFCRSERSIKALPEARIVWLAEEYAHTPLAEERLRVKERSAAGDSADPQTTGSSVNWRDAVRLLEQHLAAKESSGPNDAGCLGPLRGLSSETAWSYLQRGMAYLEYGFLPEHLEAADAELDQFCQAILTERSGVEGGAKTESLEQEAVMIGLLGRGDAAMKLGDWRQGSRLYVLAVDMLPTHRQHRIRDLLPSSADPLELWCSRFRGLSVCGGP